MPAINFLCNFSWRADYNAITFKFMTRDNRVCSNNTVTWYFWSFQNHATIAYPNFISEFYKRREALTQYYSRLFSLFRLSVCLACLLVRCRQALSGS